MTPILDLVSPVPASWWPRLWAWVQEDPAANLDDGSPTTEAAFCAEMTARAQWERSWGVRLEGDPVGVIAYRPFTETVGTFHGICFTDWVCGSGVPRQAVTQVLDQLWADGVQQIHATVFADNVRVQRFLRSLGAVRTGLVSPGTLRDGQPLDLVCLAIRNPACALRKAG